MTIEKVTSPVGRVVWGNPSKPQFKTDQKTKAQILKDGKPIEQWVFGVAFPKGDFGGLYQMMLEEAKTAYPHGTPQNFSWKLKDGDGVDSKGVPYNKREGHAGCMIMTVSTEAFAPPIYKYENNAYRRIEANEIKCGDYVRLNLNIKVNVPTVPQHTPGLYVNPLMIELVGYGSEIVTAGGDPTEAFGNQQVQLPPGASATPISSAPAGVGMPGMPQQPVYQPQMPQGYPAPQQPVYQPAPGNVPMSPGVAQPGMPQYGVTGGIQSGPTAPVNAYPSNPQLPPPAHDFVQNAGQPQQPVYQPQMPQGYPAPQQPQNFTQPQQPVYQPAGPVAAPSYPPQNNGGVNVGNAMTYPSNGMPPGMPQR